MARERLDILQEYVLHPSNNIAGCAQIQRPNGKEYYAGFAQVVPVEEDVIALVEDELRTGTTDFHVVRVPIELAAICRLGDL